MLKQVQHDTLTTQHTFLLRSLFITIKIMIMNLIDRVASPTPKFFKTVRNIGIVLAAISGSIIAAPVALPGIVIQIATYLAIASSVASALSQTAVEGE
jgi:hypothetical protein